MAPKLQESINGILALLQSVFDTEENLITLAVVLFVFDTAINMVWSKGKRNTPRQALRVAISQLVFFIVAGLLLVSLTGFGNTFRVFGWITELSYMVICGVMLWQMAENAPKLTRLAVAIGRVYQEIKRRNALMLNSDLDPDTDGKALALNPEPPSEGATENESEYASNKGNKDAQN